MEADKPVWNLLELFSHLGDVSGLGQGDCDRCGDFKPQVCLKVASAGFVDSLHVYEA